jgi:hypothetical protein
MSEESEIFKDIPVIANLTAMVWYKKRGIYEPIHFTVRFRDIPQYEILASKNFIRIWHLLIFCFPRTWTISVPVLDTERGFEMENTAILCNIDLRNTFLYFGNPVTNSKFYDYDLLGHKLKGFDKDYIKKIENIIKKKSKDGKKKKSKDKDGKKKSKSSGKRKRSEEESTSKKPKRDKEWENSTRIGLVILKHD